LLNQEKANDWIYFGSKCFAFQKYLLHHSFEENGLTASKARYAQRRQSFDKQCPYNGAMCA